MWLHIRASLRASIRRMRTRTGWPRAFAKVASSLSAAGSSTGAASGWRACGLSGGQQAAESVRGTELVEPTRQVGTIRGGPQPPVARSLSGARTRHTRRRRDGGRRRPRCRRVDPGRYGSTPRGPRGVVDGLAGRGSSSPTVANSVPLHPPAFARQTATFGQASESFLELAL